MNARVLTAEAGATLGDRMAPYLEPEEERRFADCAGRSVVIVDGASPAAGELATQIRRHGGSARFDEKRLIVVAPREAILRAAANATEAARALAAEIVRASDCAERPPSRLKLRERTLDLAARSRVMGILNVTPDSFYDGGRYASVDRARARAVELVSLGADIIDIGGQSYAHWNAPVDEAEERQRVTPVVEALVRDGLDVALSVDTYRSTVAEAALAAGAHLINDCSGLIDERLPDVVARYDAALVVMHIKGELNVREAAYPYDDAMAEIVEFLSVRLERARAAGIGADALLCDPGLEFGKEPDVDLEILARFGDLRSLGVPILFAASRKSFIGRIFHRPASDLLVPSLAAAAAGIVAGAGVVRVHDVRETVDVATMLGALRPLNRSRISIAAAMPEPVRA